MKTRAFTLFSLFALAACGAEPTSQDYANRGDPETLLSSSSDIVTVSLASKESLDELSGTVTKTPPTRAILHCPAEETLCSQAKDILGKNKVTVQETGSGSSVTLLYDRTVVKACDHHYSDNSQNNYNLSMSSFGCALRSNTVQMVTDKKQFTDPRMLGNADGEKSAQTYDNYLKPPEPKAQGSGGMSSSLINSGGDNKQQ